MVGESSERDAETGFCCPWCQARIERDESVCFELCAACGLVWLDFGSERPRLYRAVEAQVTRWEALHGKAA